LPNFKFQEWALAPLPTATGEPSGTRLRTTGLDITKRLELNKRLILFEPASSRGVQKVESAETPQTHNLSCMHR